MALRSVRRVQPRAVPPDTSQRPGLRRRTRTVRALQGGCSGTDSRWARFCRQVKSPQHSARRQPWPDQPPQRDVFPSRLCATGNCPWWLKALRGSVIPNFKWVQMPAEDTRLSSWHMSSATWQNMGADPTLPARRSGVMPPALRCARRRAQPGRGGGITPLQPPVPHSSAEIALCSSPAPARQAAPGTSHQLVSAASEERWCHRGSSQHSSCQQPLPARAFPALPPPRPSLGPEPPQDSAEEKRLLSNQRLGLLHCQGVLSLRSWGCRESAAGPTAATELELGLPAQRAAIVVDVMPACVPAEGPLESEGQSLGGGTSGSMPAPPPPSA